MQKDSKDNYNTDRSPSKVNVPIYFTELGRNVGASHSGVTVTRDIQAGLLVKAYSMGIAQGVRCIYWYEGRDSESTFYGLLNSSNAPYPAYTAMSKMVEHLGHNPTYLGWVLLNGQNYGFVFQGTAGTVMTTWAPRSNSNVVNFGQSVQVVNPVNGTTTNVNSYTLTNLPIMVAGVPANIVSTAQANKTQPFPWGGDYSNATSVSVTMGATNVDFGLHQMQPNQTSTATTYNGVAVRDCRIGLQQTFTVDPNFLSYTSMPITVSVKVRNIGTTLSGFKLLYERRGSVGVVYPAGWKTVPANGTTSPAPDAQGFYTIQWTVSDPQFVGGWGYNFAIVSDRTTENQYYLRSVTVSK